MMTMLNVSAQSFVIRDVEYNQLSGGLKDMSIGDRIAFWAEQFVGNPYDKDPIGEYVSRAVIEADERVDCMYLTFRAAELAFSSSYHQAVENALYLRFHSKGVLDENGKVVNYDDRFQYGIDMVRSGKWGKDVTAVIGKTRSIPGERGIDRIEIVDRASAVRSVERIRNGDIIFFVKDPSKRKVGEIIGHIGIASVSRAGTFLIHASGVKNKDGMVKKVDLGKYFETMPFAGIVVTRFL